MHSWATTPCIAEKIVKARGILVLPVCREQGEGGKDELREEKKLWLSGEISG